MFTIISKEKYEEMVTNTKRTSYGFLKPDCSFEEFGQRLNPISQKPYEEDCRIVTNRLLKKLGIVVQR